MENNRSIIKYLASTNGRRDQDLNIELAIAINKENNKDFVKELVENLSNKNKSIQGDCIKVLDELAMINAEIVAPYCSDILKLLHNPNNRMVWGAMAVIDYLCRKNPDEIFNSLELIMTILDNASVITRDHGVKILVQLAEKDEYYHIVWPLYLEQLESSPTNQFPSYAEWGAEVVRKENNSDLKSIINNKLNELDQASKISRLNKVLKSLQQKFKH
ncbi:MAG TPA: hypothetical protein VK590_04195 [Saprospiraceae bacterium]|nr:hypothetical protein [Saprospiraceae bacterium]